MSEKKNHNTIYFLTTLSVYLGLIVVGASPQVLAADKSTNNFVIQNQSDEDEIKSLTQTLDSYFNDLDEFLTDLKKLHQIEKFDLSYDKFAIKNQFTVPYPSSGLIRSTTFKERVNENRLKPEITAVRYSFENWADSSDCFAEKVFKDGLERTVDFDTSYNKQDFLLKITIRNDSKQKAENFVNHIKIAHNLYELDEEVALIKVLHKNTSFSKDDNNQVTIVTRLPRASIDSIIEDENKAK